MTQLGNPKLPVPTGMGIGVGAALAGFVGAYMMMGLGKKAKMTKSERMFFTVVRVLQEEIDRLAVDYQAVKDDRDTERSQFDKRLVEMRGQLDDMRKERDNKQLRVAELENLVGQLRTELAVSNSKNRRKAK